MDKNFLTSTSPSLRGFCPEHEESQSCPRPRGAAGPGQAGQLRGARCLSEDQAPARTGARRPDHPPHPGPCARRRLLPTTFATLGIRCLPAAVDAILPPPCAHPAPLPLTSRSAVARRCQGNGGASRCWERSGAVRPGTDRPPARSTARSALRSGSAVETGLAAAAGGR